MKSQAINWENPADPVVKLFVGFDVEAYVEEYELRGEDGDYSPNEQEKTLIHDAIYGVIGNLHEEMRKLLPSDSIALPDPNLLEALKNLVNLDQRSGWHSKEQDAALAAIARYDRSHRLPSASQTLVALATAVLAHAPAEANEFMSISLDDIRSAISKPGARS